MISKLESIKLRVLKDRFGDLSLDSALQLAIDTEKQGKDSTDVMRFAELLEKAEFSSESNGEIK